MKNDVTKQDVYDFWDSRPLGSYEIGAEPGEPEYYAGLIKIRETSSKYAMHLYRFAESAGKDVLDVGCGPGWISHMYAKNGANIHSVDLTPTAAKMAHDWIKHIGKEPHVSVGDAENLPFPDAMFDFVCADGVLHHTPGTEQGVREVARVMKPGARGLISLYYRNILLRGWMFPFTKFGMWLFGVRWHGTDKLKKKLTPEEFANLYDGKDNPLGKIYSVSEAKKMLVGAGLTILKKEVHYFPVRFMSIGKYVPEFIVRMLDRMVGTMIFFSVEKK